MPSELRKPLQNDLVVPEWTAGTQVHMDVSGSILRAWMPAIHAGMTEATDAWREISPFSYPVGERKVMKHFVVFRKTLSLWEREG